MQAQMCGMQRTIAHSPENATLAPCAEAHYRAAVDRFPYGDVIKRAREAAGLSQPKAAELAKVSLRALQYVESGRNANIGVLAAVAAVVGLRTIPLSAPVEGDVGAVALSPLDRAKLEDLARDLMARAEWLRERFSLDQEASTARTRPIAERPRGDESEINYPIGIRGKKPE